MWKEEEEEEKNKRKKILNLWLSNFNLTSTYGVCVIIYNIFAKEFAK